MLLIYYLLRDNKPFLFTNESFVIIYQTSCKIKPVVPYMCHKTCATITTLNAWLNRKMARRVTELVVHKAHYRNLNRRASNFKITYYAQS